jgi:hypothetical protein
MSILLEQNLFIVTSALNPNMGVINNEDRLSQTIEGLKSLREKCPTDLIVFSDGSPNKVGREIYEQISPYCDVILDMATDPDITQFAASGRKSEAENVLILKTLIIFKRNTDLMKQLSSVKRIFKLSARTLLLDDFDINQHDHFGKYAFKKSIPTWLTDNRKLLFQQLFITRMYSFCISLFDDYLMVCQNNLNDIQTQGVDTEHAHWHNIDKKYLLELEKIHCSGIMASTGQVEIY